MDTLCAAQHMQHRCMQGGESVSVVQEGSSTLSSPYKTWACVQQHLLVSYRPDICMFAHAPPRGAKAQFMSETRQAVDV